MQTEHGTPDLSILPVMYISTMKSGMDPGHPVNLIASMNKGNFQESQS